MHHYPIKVEGPILNYIKLVLVRTILYKFETAYAYMLVVLEVFISLYFQDGGYLDENIISCSKPTLFFVG